MCCSVMWCVVGCGSGDLKEVRCSVLQCVAVCCNVVQCIEMCCSVLQCVAVVYICICNYMYM